ncbi:hypothetical protein [Kamptonema formosum]|nr:hypothetical protein [Oscillatoria sp. PCC 10802]
MLEKLLQATTITLLLHMLVSVSPTPTRTPLSWQPPEAPQVILGYGRN